MSREKVTKQRITVTTACLMANVLISCILSTITVRSQPPAVPCTDEAAAQTLGKWGRLGQDDLAMADPSFPEEQYKSVLTKAQKTIDIIRETYPELVGVDGRSKRGIRGKPIDTIGPPPFRATIGFFRYYCVPDTPSYPSNRGKVVLEGETDTWIEVYFNGFGNLLGSGLGGILGEAGKDLYDFPKSVGEIKGLALFQLKDAGTKRQQIVVIAANNRMPYVPVSREEYLQIRLKKNKDQFGRDAVLSEDEKRNFTTAIENMSPAERQLQAIVRDHSALPGKGKVFTTEAEGGDRLVKIDRGFFDPKLPRSAIQFMVISLRWNEKDTAKSELIRQFKQNFDFDSLRLMLGK
jgi:hypothetical protein